MDKIRHNKYKNKYIKYKNKYIELKKQLGGNNNKIIYKSLTGFPTVIKNDKHVYIISFKNNNSIHSSMNIDNPEITSNMYEYYMLAGLLIINQPKNYLLIGFGGGYTAKIILKLLPNINLDIVEYSEEMIHVGKEYFNFIPSINTNIYINDGVKYINNLEEKKYDIISIDAFDENSNIPANFLTDIFFNKIKEHLTENGLLIINSISESVTVKNLLEKNFNYFICITIAGNKINNQNSYDNLMNNINEQINYVFIASMNNFIDITKLNKFSTPYDIKIPIENMYNGLVTSINRKNIIT
jgi:predicted O-methyltransferase YrrM